MFIHSRSIIVFLLIFALILGIASTIPLRSDHPISEEEYDEYYYENGDYDLLDRLRSENMEREGRQNVGRGFRETVEINNEYGIAIEETGFSNNQNQPYLDKKININNDTGIVVGGITSPKEIIYNVGENSTHPERIYEVDGVVFGLN